MLGIGGTPLQQELYTVSNSCHEKPPAAAQQVQGEAVGLCETPQQCWSLSRSVFSCVWAVSTVALPAGMGEVLDCFAWLCSCFQRAAAGSSLIGIGVQ